MRPLYIVTPLLIVMILAGIFVLAPAIEKYQHDHTVVNTVHYTGTVTKVRPDEYTTFIMVGKVMEPQIHYYWDLTITANGQTLMPRAYCDAYTVGENVTVNYVTYLNAPPEYQPQLTC